MCGRSGKLYGQSTPDGKRGGMAFSMSLEEYNKNADDIMANDPPQRWTPEFDQVDLSDELARTQGGLEAARKLLEGEQIAHETTKRKLEESEEQVRSKSAELRLLSKKPKPKKKANKR